ncbi:hypothetical protein MMC26_002349 [Xylographa opegraphella]|nr:hypothetical protein [Xylographa opegraphella]
MASKIPLDLKNETNYESRFLDDVASPTEPFTAYSAPLHRRLKSRHLQMIAIGGIIGPGLLVGSGNALHLAGPGGILISFSLVGIIVFFVMQSLGELATLIPVTGSFTEYAQRFVDDSLSFALGWAYWYLWVTVLANEYNAVSLVILYWTDVVPQWAWILIFWFIFLSFSMLGVLAYGEVEFWLSFVKIISISVFFIVAIFISAGCIGPQKIGFKYWHDPGAFADSINGVAKTFVIAGTLYAGTEMVGITSGEADNPRRAVPRAIRQVFWRILIFYVGMMFFIGILLPYNSPRLLAPGSKTAASPLTITLDEAGIAPAASLINALIVIAVISAGNSSLYVSSRTMLFMARNGKAPKILGRTNKAGVPWVALLFSNLIACIAFLSVSSSAVRFRNGMRAQCQSLDTLPFKAMWYPYGTYAALAANIFLIFFQGYTAFLTPFSATDFVTNYILLPVFVLLVLGYKYWKRTKWVRLEDMDIWSGRRAELEGGELEKSGRLWRRARDVVIG